MAETTSTKADAIKAWHEADTADKKAEAVKKFPVLADMYALATNIAAQPQKPITKL